MINFDFVERPITPVDSDDDIHETPPPSAKKSTPAPAQAQHGDELVATQFNQPALQHQPAKPAVVLPPIKPAPAADLAAAEPIGPKAEPPKLGAVPSPVGIVTNPSDDEPKIERPPIVLPPLDTFKKSTARVARSLMFWKKSADIVQLSIFGLPEVNPGQRTNFMVYAHVPELYGSVTTLCRALLADSELLGSAYVDEPVGHDTELVLHMALANAGVAKSLLNLTWVGQTTPKSFEVFVPWESPSGLASGVLSVGMDNRRVGVVPLHFVVRARVKNAHEKT
jgi:hypothetical protein